MLRVHLDTVLVMLNPVLSDAAGAVVDLSHASYSVHKCRSRACNPDCGNQCASQSN